MRYTSEDTNAKNMSEEISFSVASELDVEPCVVANLYMRISEKHVPSYTFKKDMSILKKVATMSKSPHTGSYGGAPTQGIH